MIPQLTEKEALSPVVLAFVDALTSREFTGEVETHYGGRLCAATDNSIYHVTPQAVLFPRSQANVQCIFQNGCQDPFLRLIIGFLFSGHGSRQEQG